MHSNSRKIFSAQTGVHAQLATLVARHAASVYRKPIADYNQRAFDASMACWREHSGAPLILDAGCGVGLSTYYLAQRFPAHFVIGVDQSADRLDRGAGWSQAVPPNMLLVRADLVDYWRLLQAAGICVDRHYILYPNPWPKVGQLARRWHAHAVFPTIVALGGVFECRSNWRIYIDECAAALSQLTAHAVVSEAYATDVPITPFEKKYLGSGHALWRCISTMPYNAPTVQMPPPVV